MESRESTECRVQIFNQGGEWFGIVQLPKRGKIHLQNSSISIVLLAVMWELLNFYPGPHK